MTWLPRLVILLLLGLLGVAQSQQKDAVTCEMAVGDQYRQLTTAPTPIMPPNPTAMTWTAQLADMLTHFRIRHTEATIEEQQAIRYKRSVAELLEQVRQLQARLALAEAAKEAPAPAAAATPPPSN